MSSGWQTKTNVRHCEERSPVQCEAYPGQSDEAISQLKARLLHFVRNDGNVVFCALLLFFVLMSANLYAFFDSRAIKTESFTLFYPPGYEGEAIELLSAMEYYKYSPEKIIGNKFLNLPVVLGDCGQYSNGSADPVNRRINVIDYETGEADWFALVAVHEYSHMLQMTKAGGVPGLLTSVFSPVISPNMIFSTPWVWEGTTTYNESQISKYMGRLNDGSFDTYMAGRVASGREVSLLDATYQPLEAPAGMMYLYGGEFLNYLAKTYGQEKFVQFYKSYGDSLLSYFSPLLPMIAMDNTFAEVYGKPTWKLWEEWNAAEKERFKNFKVTGEKLTSAGWTIYSTAFENGKTYVTRAYTKKTTALGTRGYSEIVSVSEKGKEEVVVSDSVNLLLPVQFDSGKMYYGLYDIKKGFPNKWTSSYGLYTRLMKKNLSTGREREVASGAIRAFYVEEEGTLVIAEDLPASYGSVVYRFDTLTEKKEELFRSDALLVMELAKGGSGVYAIAKEKAQNPEVCVFDVTAKKITPLFKTPWSEKNLRVYGDKLFFTANYSGVEMGYCREIKTGKTYALAENTVMSAPALDEKNSMVYFAGSTDAGNDLFRIKYEPRPYTLPLGPGDMKPAPLLAKEQYKEGSYWDNIATLLPHTRVPFVTFDSQGTQTAGLMLMGSDALEDFTYQLTPLYDIKNNRLFLDATLSVTAFMPWTLYALTIQSTGTDFEAGVSFPLYAGLRNGLTRLIVDAGYGIYRPGDEVRRIIFSALTAVFKGPDTDAFIRFTYNNENSWIQSGRDTRGFIANLNLSQTTMFGEAVLDSQYILHTAGYKNVFPAIRGYSEGSGGTSGSVIQATVTPMMIKFRNGLWNPNIYIEDISGAIFFDSEMTDCQTQFSYGLELTAEVKGFFHLATETGYRLSVTREGAVVHGVLFKGLF